jgi:hypothetical protein
LTGIFQGFIGKIWENHIAIYGARSILMLIIYKKVALIGAIIGVIHYKFATRINIH